MNKIEQAIETDIDAAIEKEHDLVCSRCGHELDKEDIEAGILTTWGDPVCVGCYEKVVF